MRLATRRVSLPPEYHGGQSSLRIGLPRVACYLTNTWQIDCHFVRFDAARCAFDELPIFISKLPLKRVATPHGFEP